MCRYYVYVINNNKLHCGRNNLQANILMKIEIGVDYFNCTCGSVLTFLVQNN